MSHPVSTLHPIGMGAPDARMRPEPSSLCGRLRGRLCDQVKWYQDVEEVN
jgi:hypothetical protein